MEEIMIRTLMLAATLAGSIAATATDALGQYRGGRGYGWGGNGGWSGYGRNWGYNGYTGGYTNGYYGSGYNYYHSPYYSNYSGSYYAPIVPQTYESPSYYYSVPSTSGTVAPAGYSTTDSASTLATINVLLPVADADVWLGSTQTTSRGTQRTFQSPPLQPGMDYSYTVKAHWVENGKPIDQAREVTVRAGQTSTVDFRTSSQAEQVPLPDRRNK